MREKKIAQETSAQSEFGIKTEKIAVNENVNYHFLEKEKLLFLNAKSVFRF